MGHRLQTQRLCPLIPTLRMKARGGAASGGGASAIPGIGVGALPEDPFPLCEDAARRRLPVSQEADPPQTRKRPVA